MQNYLAGSVSDSYGVSGQGEKQKPKGQAKTSPINVKSANPQDVVPTSPPSSPSTSPKLQPHSAIQRIAPPSPPSSPKYSGADFQGASSLPDSPTGSPVSSHTRALQSPPSSPRQQMDEAKILSPKDAVFYANEFRASTLRNEALVPEINTKIADIKRKKSDFESRYGRFESPKKVENLNDAILFSEDGEEMPQAVARLKGENQRLEERLNKLREYSKAIDAEILKKSPVSDNYAGELTPEQEKEILANSVELIQNHRELVKQVNAFVGAIKNSITSRDAYNQQLVSLKQSIDQVKNNVKTDDLILPNALSEINVDTNLNLDEASPFSQKDGETLAQAMLRLKDDKTIIGILRRRSAELQHYYDRAIGAGYERKVAGLTTQINLAQALLTQRLAEKGKIIDGYKTDIASLEKENAELRQKLEAWNNDEKAKYSSSLVVGLPNAASTLPEMQKSSDELISGPEDIEKKFSKHKAELQVENALLVEGVSEVNAIKSEYISRKQEEFYRDNAAAQEIMAKGKILEEKINATVLKVANIIGENVNYILPKMVDSSKIEMILDDDDYDVVQHKIAELANYEKSVCERNDKLTKRLEQAETILLKATVAKGKLDKLEGDNVEIDRIKARIDGYEKKVKEFISSPAVLEEKAQDVYTKDNKRAKQFVLEKEAFKADLDELADCTSKFKCTVEEKESSQNVEVLSDNLDTGIITRFANYGSDDGLSRKLDELSRTQRVVEFLDKNKEGLKLLQKRDSRLYGAIETYLKSAAATQDNIDVLSMNVEKVELQERAYVSDTLAKLVNELRKRFFERYKEIYGRAAGVGSIDEVRAKWVGFGGAWRRFWTSPAKNKQLELLFALGDLLSETEGIIVGGHSLEELQSSSAFGLNLNLAHGKFSIRGKSIPVPGSINLSTGDTEVLDTHLNGLLDNATTAKKALDDGLEALLSSVSVKEVSSDASVTTSSTNNANATDNTNVSHGATPPGGLSPVEKAVIEQSCGGSVATTSLPQIFTQPIPLDLGANFSTTFGVESVAARHQQTSSSSVTQNRTSTLSSTASSSTADIVNVLNPETASASNQGVSTSSSINCSTNSNNSTSGGVSNHSLAMSDSKLKEIPGSVKEIPGSVNDLEEFKSLFEKIVSAHPGKNITESDRIDVGESLSKLFRGVQDVNLMDALRVARELFENLKNRFSSQIRLLAGSVSSLITGAMIRVEGILKLSDSTGSTGSNEVICLIDNMLLHYDNYADRVRPLSSKATLNSVIPTQEDINDLGPIKEVLRQPFIDYINKHDEAAKKGQSSKPGSKNFDYRWKCEYARYIVDEINGADGKYPLVIDSFSTFLANKKITDTDALFQSYNDSRSALRPAVVDLAKSDGAKKLQLDVKVDDLSKRMACYAPSSLAYR